MATLPATSNTGVQNITVQYTDAANSQIVNETNIGIRQPGIYSGGWLNISSNVMQISPIVAEILDNVSTLGAATPNQVRIEIDILSGVYAATLSLSGLSATQYVVMSWAVPTSTSPTWANLFLVGPGSTYTTLGAIPSSFGGYVVLGQAVWGGSSFSVGYTGRSDPPTADYALRVEVNPFSTTSVNVRGGTAVVGTSVPTLAQTVSLVGQPVGTYLVTVGGTGTVYASTPKTWGYNGLCVLAEVPWSGTAVNGSILDTRNSAAITQHGSFWLPSPVVILNGLGIVTSGYVTANTTNFPLLATAIPPYATTLIVNAWGYGDNTASNVFLTIKSGVSAPALNVLYLYANTGGDTAVSGNANVSMVPCTAGPSFQYQLAGTLGYGVSVNLNVVGYVV